MEYSQCLCHCDGEWTCNERFSRNICDPPQQRVANVEGDCGSCLVDSRVVRGNTYFDMVSECFRLVSWCFEPSQLQRIIFGLEVGGGGEEGRTGSS